MSLFNAIEGIVKNRNVSYQDVEALPFYEFKFIMDNIKEEKDKEEEERNKQESDSKSSYKTPNKSTFKPMDTGKMMRDSQRNMQKHMPKI